MLTINVLIPYVMWQSPSLKQFWLWHRPVA